MTNRRFDLIFVGATRMQQLTATMELRESFFNERRNKSDYVGEPSRFEF